QALNAGGRPGLERWLRTHLRPAQAPNSIVLVWEIKDDWGRRGRRGEPPQPPRDIIDRPMPWGLARYLNSQPGTGPQRSQGAPAARTLAFLTDPRTGTQYETLFMQAPVTLFGIWAAPNTLITALAI